MQFIRAFGQRQRYSWIIMAFNNCAAISKLRTVRFSLKLINWWSASLRIRAVICVWWCHSRAKSNLQKIKPSEHEIYYQSLNPMSGCVMHRGRDAFLADTFAWDKTYTYKMNTHDRSYQFFCRTSTARLWVNIEALMCHFCSLPTYQGVAKYSVFYRIAWLELMSQLRTARNASMELKLDETNSI